MDYGNNQPTFHRWNACGSSKVFMQQRSANRARKTLPCKPKKLHKVTGIAHVKSLCFVKSLGRHTYIGVGAPLGTHSQVRLATRKRHLATCKPHLATRKRHLATCKPHLATCKPRLTTFLLWPAAACPRPPQPHPNPPN